MDFCCTSFTEKNLEDLLMKNFYRMKIYKSMDLTTLREILKNFSLYEAENEQFNKIINISDRAKKNFENSQKQILKEKYSMICRNYLYDYEPNNKHMIFQENFLEKIFEMSDAKKEKIILLLYPLINNSTKKVYLTDLFFLNCPENFKSQDNEKIVYLKFKNLLCEYFHKVLFCSYSALANFYSSNNQVFEEIMDTVNNIITYEKVENFLEFFLKKFEDLKFKKTDSNKIKFKDKSPSLIEKQKILENVEIEKEEINQFFENYTFIHNISDLIPNYIKFYEIKSQSCI